MKLLKKMRDRIRNRLASFLIRTRLAVCNNRGDGFVGEGLKILISVVIGALLLAGLYALFNGKILPALSTKIDGLFNYSGS